MSTPSMFQLTQGARAGAGAPAGVVAAVRQAAARTGVDFSYLMAKAAQESGFDPAARAHTSSATGLFQFIERTWLEMVQTYGSRHGLAREAAAIARRPDGTPEVADPAMRRRILDLRRDPALSALMAAEYARANRAYLARTVGGRIGATELYLAHFLGAGGAAKFLSALRQDPGRSAAELLPEAAAANRGVFYDPAGRPRSLRAIYDRFAARFGAGTTGPGTGAPTAPAVRPPAGAAAQGAAGREPFDAGRALPIQPLPLFTVLMLQRLDAPLDAWDSRRDERAAGQDGRRSA